MNHPLREPKPGSLMLEDGAPPESDTLILKVLSLAGFTGISEVQLKSWQDVLRGCFRNINSNAGVRLANARNRLAGELERRRVAHSFAKSHGRAPLKSSLD